MGDIWYIGTVIGMKRELYCRNGAQILSEDGCYYLRYDAGSIASQIREIPISCEEARRIMSFRDMEEFAVFLSTDCYERWMDSRQVVPSEFVGDTWKLMMGQ